MSFLDDDDTFTELAEEERRRRSRRSSSVPFLRLLAAVGLAAAVVLIAILGIRGWLDSRESAGYTAYMTEATRIIKESDKMGADLSQLLMEPGDSTRKDVQTKLDQYIERSTKLKVEAKDLTVPADLREAHQWYVATMQLRSRGLENLKPSLMNALEVRDEEVSSGQIARAMQLLLLSDVAYEEFFVSRASTVLKERNIEGLSVPGTDFVGDSALASQAKVKEILVTLKNSDSLRSVRGVALVKVVALPSEKVIEKDARYNLTATDQLSFAVTVENQGNEIETDVPVTLQLNSESGTQPQLQTVKIAELKPKEQKTVSITGLNPTEYGAEAVLEVEVGPVPDEKLLDNNSLLSYVIFTL
jgi:hypothetical protein